MGSIHTEAYLATLNSILRNGPSNESTKQFAKRIGLVTGGAVLGTMAMGPVGLAVGAGLGGSAASEVGCGRELEDMLHHIARMSFANKLGLVRHLEVLVGSTDTDALAAYAKQNKANQGEILAATIDFLIDNCDYQVNIDSSLISVEHAANRCGRRKNNPTKLALDFNSDDYWD